MIKKLCATIILLINFHAYAQNFKWAKDLGDRSLINTRCVKTDLQGNVYISGDYTGVYDFDPGPGTYTLSTVAGISNCFVTKLDASGNLVWAKNIGGSGNMSGYSLAVEPNGTAYITGSFYLTIDFDPGPLAYNLSTLNPTSVYDSDIFILKLDSSGAFIWVKQFGNISSDYGTALTVDKTGNVFVTGGFDGIVDFDPGPLTFNLIGGPADSTFILKLDVSGDFLWAKKMSNIYISRLVADSSGNMYATGMFNMTKDFDPGPAVYNLTSVHINVFVLKLTSSGNFSWVSAFENDDYCEVFSITSDRWGNVYTTGMFQGSLDADPGPATCILSSSGPIGTTEIFIAKTDSAGHFKWAKSFGGIGEDWGLGIETNYKGEVYAVGYFTGRNSFNHSTDSLIANGSGGNVLILKLDSIGNLLKARGIGNLTGSEADAVAVDDFGNVFLLGEFGQTMDFDPDSGVYMLTAQPAQSVNNFLIKFNEQSVGIREHSDDKKYFELYPNPSTGVFTLKSNENIKLNLTSTIGEVIQTIDLKKDNAQQVNIEELSSGIYFLTGQAIHGAVSKKIIVTR